MKKIILVLVVVLLPIIGQADNSSGKVEAESGFDVSKWMAYYYQNPEPERTFEAIRIFHVDSSLLKPNAQPPIIAFLAAVLRDNSDLTAHLLDSCSFLNQEERWIIYNALWYADTKEARGILKDQEKRNKFLKPFVDGDPPDIVKSKELQPSVFDMCWASFTATGDTKYVDKIISVFDQGHDETDPVTKVIIDSARWSIKSFCQQHKIVLKHCQKVVDDLPESSRAELQAILDMLDD